MVNQLFNTDAWFSVHKSPNIIEVKMPETSFLSHDRLSRGVKNSTRLGRLE